MKKTATYISAIDHKPFDVEYDDDDPCIICKLPVIEASVGGTAVCPWCDCGYDRDGTKWDYAKMMKMIGKTPVVGTVITLTDHGNH